MRLRVYYGWAKLNKVVKREALTVIFLNDDPGPRYNKDGYNGVSRYINVAYSRVQTSEEESDRVHVNRMYSVYSIFMDDKYVQGSLERALQVNYDSDQYNVSRVDRDIRPGAHGYAGIGCRKCRRVVYAVACHGGLTVRLQLLYDAALALGEDACAYAPYADFIRYSLCRARVVAGYHHGAHAELFKLLYRLAAVVLHGICCGYYTQQPAALCEQHRRFAAVGKLVGFALDIPADLCFCPDEAERSGVYALPADDP